MSLVHIERRSSPSYAELVANFQGSARFIRKDGREWLVAPMTSLKEQVLVGSKGALFYPNSEIQANVSDWDEIPLTLYHPYDPISGRHLSAKDKGVLQRQQLGVVKKSIFNEKLQHEAWFDVLLTGERDKKLAPLDRILPRLLEGRPIEVSTGLFTDQIPAPPNSNYHGKRYDSIAVRYVPDHIAVLPNQVGACSIDMGCGVLVNSSFDDEDLTSNAFPPHQPPPTQRPLPPHQLPTQQPAPPVPPPTQTAPPPAAKPIPPAQPDPSLPPEEDDGKKGAAMSSEAVAATIKAAEEHVKALDASLKSGDMKVARGHLKAIQQILKTTEEVKMKTEPKVTDTATDGVPPPPQAPQIPQPTSPAATNPAMNASVQSHGIKIDGDKKKLTIREACDCGTCNECTTKNATSLPMSPPIASVATNIKIPNAIQKDKSVSRKAVKALADTVKAGSTLTGGITKLGGGTARRAEKGIYKGNNNVASNPSTKAMNATLGCHSSTLKESHLNAARLHEKAARSASDDKDTRAVEAHNVIAKAHRDRVGAISNTNKVQPRHQENGRYLPLNAGTGKGDLFRGANKGIGSHLDEDVCECGNPVKNSKDRCINCGGMITNKKKKAAINVNVLRSAMRLTSKLFTKYQE